MYDHFIHAAILNQATPSLMLVIDHSLWLAVMFVCEQLFTGEINDSRGVDSAPARHGRAARVK